MTQNAQNFVTLCKSMIIEKDVTTEDDFLDLDALLNTPQFLASNMNEVRFHDFKNLAHKYLCCKNSIESDVMIACDVCESLFHPQCVAMNEDVVNQNISNFICDSCQPANEEEELKFSKSKKRERYKKQSI